MAIWREPVLRTISEARHTLERRTLVVLCGTREPAGSFEVYCRRWTGPLDLIPFGPHTARNPERVIEYRAAGRPRFATLDEARECAEAWARRLPDFAREEFEAQIPLPPSRPRE
jgi:hypothetical protein